MTNVPTITFGPRGFIAPPEADVLAGVQEDISDAFGGGVNPALNTPQGQLAVSEASIIGNTNDEFVFFSNQVDPAYAMGRMQDAIARIYFLERDPATSTVVSATCVGLQGTIIPPGALAQSEDGNLYACVDGGTIPVGGSIDLNFACNVTGPISCPINTLDQIYRAIPGWDTINNTSEGVLGNNVESRSAFETRRAASVALNSVGSLPSIRGSVLSVAGVLDAYVTENVTAAPVTVRGFTIAAKSLYVAAVGGTNQDIAEAIWKKKAPGCAYNGNETVTVEDQNSGYTPPYPSYPVSFERPAALPILFAVVILDSTEVPADAATQIQNAIINAFGGGDGGPRAQIGGTILASRFYAPIAVLGPWALIQSLLIGSADNQNASFTASVAGIVLTVTAVASGALAVGQTVIAEGIADGVTILSLGSGSGGTGTYNLSSDQGTVTSEDMVSVLPTRTSIDVGISQAPTISAANIAVAI